MFVILTACGCLLSSPARFRCPGRDHRWSARRVARFFAVRRRNRSELSGLFRSAGLARPLVCTSGFPLCSGGEFSSPFGPWEPSALVDLLHGSSWSCANCPYYQGVPVSVFIDIRKNCPNPGFELGTLTYSWERGSHWAMGPPNGPVLTDMNVYRRSYQ